MSIIVDDTDYGDSGRRDYVPRGQQYVALPQQQRNVRPRPQRRRMAATNPALALAMGMIPNQRRRVGRRRRKATRRPRRKGNTSKRINRPLISLCAAKYASALADPEHTPIGACVPWGFPQSTQKAKGHAAGRMTVGTSGAGYVLVSMGCASDALQVQYTSSTSVGGPNALFSAYTNLQTSNATNLPYQQSAMSANVVQTRGVCCVLKVRYAGTEANRNGTVYAYEHPSHNGCDSMTANTILSSVNRTDERPRMDGSWHSLVFSGPASSGEANFTTNTVYCTAGQFWGIIYVAGTSGDIYDWETYHQVEYSGPTLQAQGAAEADSDGYSAVIGAFKNQVQGSPVTTEMGKALFSSILKGAGQTLTDAIRSYGPGVAAQAFSSFLLPGGSPHLAIEL